MTDHQIVLTFDNLSEASELERGTWPTGAPLGRHPSVTTALPRLLDALDRHALTATFFVEALNCELYPEAVTELTTRGHDLGVHGWRHEAWGQLEADREAELITRCGDAFATIDRRPHGFRPPGGALTPSSAQLLTDAGYRWCSTAAPAQSTPGLRDIAFDWALVDAYHLMDRFAPLRERRNDPRDPADAPRVGDTLLTRLTEGTGTDVVILHPFLMLDDAWWNQVQRLLAALDDLQRSAGVSVLTADACVQAGT